MSDTTTLPPDSLTPPADRRVKVGHLVVGLVFLGLAGAWGLHAAGVLRGVGGAVVVPLVLVVAGSLGLVAMVVGRLRRPRDRQEQSDEVVAPGRDAEPVATPSSGTAPPDDGTEETAPLVTHRAGTTGPAAHDDPHTGPGAPAETDPETDPENPHPENAHPEEQR